MTQSAAALLRVLAILLVIAGVTFFGDRLVAFFQAPVKAQLGAARGDNKAFKAGAAAQNKGVDALQADGNARQAKGRAAVATAGADEEARAKAILEAPPAGDSDYERAVNRIDRELGLK